MRSVKFGLILFVFGVLATLGSVYADAMTSKKYVDEILSGLRQPEYDSVFTLSGGATAYTLTVPYSDFVYVSGVRLRVKMPVGNAANATLDITPSGGAALGAKNIRYNNENITAFKLAAYHIYDLVYDGTYWQLVGEGSLTMGPSSVLETGNIITGISSQANGTITYTYQSADDLAESDAYYNNYVILTPNGLPASRYSLPTCDDIMNCVNDGEKLSGVIAINNDNDSLAYSTNSARATLDNGGNCENVPIYHAGRPIQKGQLVRNALYEFVYAKNCVKNIDGISSDCFIVQDSPVNDFLIGMGCDNYGNCSLATTHPRLNKIDGARLVVQMESQQDIALSLYINKWGVSPIVYEGNIPISKEHPLIKGSVYELVFSENLSAWQVIGTQRVPNTYWMSPIPLSAGPNMIISSVPLDGIESGSRFMVQITSGNVDTAATLKIISPILAARPVLKNGAELSEQNFLAENAVYEFVYNGESWHALGGDTIYKVATSGSGNVVSGISVSGNTIIQNLTDAAGGSGGGVAVGTLGGSASAFTLTGTGVPSDFALEKGAHIIATMPDSISGNSAGPTISITPNGGAALGPVSIKKGSLAIPADSMTAFKVYDLVYDGTAFQLMGKYDAPSVSDRSLNVMSGFYQFTGNSVNDSSLAVIALTGRGNTNYAGLQITTDSPASGGDQYRAMTVSRGVVDFTGTTTPISGFDSANPVVVMVPTPALPQ